MRIVNVTLTIALLIVLSVAPTFADDTQQGDLDRQQAFSIEAQALDAALLDFSDQANVQVMVAAATVEGLETNGVEGTYTARSALAALLDSNDLQFTEVGKTVTVTPTSDQGGDSDSKNARPAPILLAQNTSSQTQTTVRQSSDGGTSVVTGRVTDARTGANLKGAKITIEETGQWTSTSNLGEFRFASVPSGRATLTVSFLGYVGQSITISIRGDTVEQDFVLRGGTEIEEIMVFGQRSARAQSLNLERTAPNSSSVLAADMLGQFNGITIAEALRRAPGVSFVPDEDTGTGANIIIRGMNSDLNQIQLNGIRVLDATGLGRSADLSTFLTENIESVTVNKTLLPSQDSNGAGGLVQIETKSPLDRDRRFVSFGVEYGRRSDGDFGNSTQFNGTLSGIFGDRDDFGVSVFGSYREEEFTRVRYRTGPSAFGAYLPSGVESTREIDPRTLFPFEAGNDEAFLSSATAFQGSTVEETFSAGLGVEKLFGDHTTIEVNYVFASTENDDFDLVTGAGSISGYFDSTAIPGAGGDIRTFYTSENPFSFLPDGIYGEVFRSASVNRDQKDEFHTITLDGETFVSDWEFGYKIGYSDAENVTPESYSVRLGSLFRPDGFSTLFDRSDFNDAILGNTIDGRIISIFEPISPGSSNRFVLPGFTDEAFEFYNDVDALPLELIRLNPGLFGSSDAVTLAGSTRRNFSSSPFDYIEAGVNYHDATFESGRRGLSTTYRPVGNVSVADAGLSFGPGLLSSFGVSDDYASLDLGSVERSISSLDRFVAEGIFAESVGSPFDDDRTTSEETLAYYVEATASLRSFEIIGGVRIERIDVSSSFIDAPNITNEFGERLFGLEASLGGSVSETVSQTNVLPRILVNYRPTENIVARAGYFTTVSRPQISNLTDRRSILLDLRPESGLDRNQPILGITRGNPDLRPAKTHNFDASFEWYFSDVGALKAVGFYKVIENPLQSNFSQSGIEELPSEVVLPDDPIFQNLPSNLFVSVSQPINGDENNEIWGIELVAERQLTFLPDYWNSLGLYANYTYTDSSGVQRLSISSSIDPNGFVEVDDVPFEGSPQDSGTFGLTYSGYGIDASLLYSFQDRRLASYNAFGLHDFDEQIETLDFRIDYVLELGERRVRLFARAEDLLRSEDEAFLETSVGGDGGVPKYFTGATYFGGRSFSVGASVAF